MLQMKRKPFPLAGLFEAMFGFAPKNGNSSIFAGSGIEVMKAPYLGKNGHIAIGTNYIERAIYHLEKRGFAFDESTKKNRCFGQFDSHLF